MNSYTKEVNDNMENNFEIKIKSKKFSTEKRQPT